MDAAPHTPSPTHFRISRTQDGWHIEVGSPALFADALNAARSMLDLPMPPPVPMTADQGHVPAPRPMQAPVAVLAAPRHNDAPGAMLSDLMKNYLHEYVPVDRKLNQKGQVECRASLDLFLQLTGDRPLSTLTQDHCRRFVHNIQKWPIHSSKKPEFRDLVDPALVFQKADELNAKRLSSVTVRNRANYVMGFARWLRKTNQLDFDLFAGCILPSAKQEVHRRPPTETELAVIFDAKNREVLNAPHAWWAPLLGIYTGARLREIGQLYLDDIDRIGGIDCIHINDRFEDQQLKTESSRRVVPIHPELKRLGFLDYVEELRANGQSLLFPGLPWLGGEGIKDPGRKIGRQFTEAYLANTCRINDPTLTFHSFRHFFATQADRADLDDARIARLTGHKLERQNALRKNYIQARTLPERYSDLQSLGLPVFDLAPYKHGQFSGWFATSRRMVKKPLPNNLPKPRVSRLAGTEPPLSPPSPDA